MPSLRETVELTQCLGPVKTEARFKHAFDRQLKFDTKANPQLSIPDIKIIFEAGGSVTKVSPLESEANRTKMCIRKELTVHAVLRRAGFSSRKVDFRGISYGGGSRSRLQHHEQKEGSQVLDEDGRARCGLAGEEKNAVRLKWVKGRDRTPHATRRARRA